MMCKKTFIWRRRHQRSIIRRENNQQFKNRFVVIQPIKTRIFKKVIGKNFSTMRNLFPFRRPWHLSIPSSACKKNLLGEGRYVVVQVILVILSEKFTYNIQNVPNVHFNYLALTISVTTSFKAWFTYPLNTLQSFHLNTTIFPSTLVLNNCHLWTA